MVPSSSILARRISWTEEPGGLQSVESSTHHSPQEPGPSKIQKAPTKPEAQRPDRQDLDLDFECFVTSVLWLLSCHALNPKYTLCKVPVSIQGSSVSRISLALRRTTRTTGVNHRISLGSLVTQMVKESACNAGALGSISGLGRSPGGEHSNPLQYSCLENSKDRGAMSLGYQRVGHG